MQKLDTINIKCTAWAYSIVINFLLITIVAGFVYNYQRSLSTDKVFKIHGYLMTVFDENENIADAITAKYTTLLENTVCNMTPLYHNQKTYGLNYSNKTMNPDYNGTLLSLTPLDSRGDCLVYAISFIIKALMKNHLIAHNGFRYILSEQNQFIYTFSHVESDKFKITDSRMFNDIPTYIASVPEYYTRKLTKK